MALTDNEIKIIADGMKDSATMATLNSLTYVQKGLECLKKTMEEYPQITKEQMLDLLIDFFKMSIKQIEKK